MKLLAVVPENTQRTCFSEAARRRLAQLGELRWEPTFPKSYKDAAWPAVFAGADVVITGWGTPPVTPDCLNAAPKLKLIAHAAGSVGAVTREAWDRGILVTNVMPVMAMGVAEFTVLCALSGVKRFDALLDPSKRAGIPFYDVPGPGFGLRGKIVGLVGLGIIARQVVDLLKPFGCRLIAYDPYVADEVPAEYGVERVDLDDLMKTADVVSLHAPGVPANQGLINLDRLKMLKPGAVLINTARGGLLDHTGLAAVAREGKISAYLDVTRPEPLPEDHPLLRLKNVVITPHIAGPTVEGRLQMGDACVADVERFIRGEKVLYEVTRDMVQNQSTE